MTAHLPPTEPACDGHHVHSNELNDENRAGELLAAVRRAKGRHKRSDGSPNDCESLVRRALAEYWHEVRVRVEAQGAGLPAGELWDLVQAVRETVGETTGVRLADGRAVRLWRSPVLCAGLREVESAAKRLRPVILARAHLLRRREALALLAQTGQRATGAAVQPAGSELGQYGQQHAACEQHLRRAAWLARRAMSLELLAELTIDAQTSIDSPQSASTGESWHADGYPAHRSGGGAGIINQNALMPGVERAMWDGDTDPAGRPWAGFCLLANAPYCPGVDHPLVRAALLKLWASHLRGRCEPSAGGTAIFRWTLCRAGRRELAALPIGEALVARAQSFREAYAAALGDEADATCWVIEHVRAAQDALGALHGESAGQTASSGVAGAPGRRKPERPEAVWESAERVSATGAALNRRQREVLRAVAEDPERNITIAEHQREQGVAFATARADLLHLAAHGLLLQRKVERKFVFVSPAAGAAQRITTGASETVTSPGRRAKANPLPPVPCVRRPSSNDFGYEL